MKQFVIITGNPVDGIQIYGPFTDGESATEWAERKVRDTDWWVYALQTETE